jgi:leader peptidase (prepilin peptidase)/N-methyltransferase
MAVFIFLAFLTFHDIKNRQLPIRLIGIFGIAMVGICFAKGYFGSWEIGVRILPGMFLVIVAYLTNQSIGYGDGIVIMLIGLICDIHVMITFILLAFLLSAIASILLLISRKGNKQSKIPFMPFLLTAWCVCQIWVW